jgi:hypothetical protein
MRPVRKYHVDQDGTLCLEDDDVGLSHDVDFHSLKELVTIPYNYIKHCKSIYLIDCEKICTMSTSLNHLDWLCISFCSSFDSLPTGLVNLRCLYISSCTKLTSLPDDLMNLETLIVYEQPTFKFPLWLGRLKYVYIDGKRISEERLAARERKLGGMMVLLHQGYVPEDVVREVLSFLSMV